MWISIIQVELMNIHTNIPRHWLPAGIFKIDQHKLSVVNSRNQNVVFLRAQTGGGMTRLNFALDSIASQETNMRSALGRIEDVDIATESANLARYSILMQASAAMAVQANIQNEVALMLLR